MSSPTESKTRTLTIAEVTVDSSIQPRHSLNQDKVEHYRQLLTSGTELDPIDVFYDGESIWLSDGFHRLNAHHAVGHSEILATIHSGDKRAAYLYSLEKNAKHGLSLTLQERREAAERLVLDPIWSKWSNSQIAKICGLNHKTVKKLKSELVLNRNISSDRKSQSSQSNQNLLSSVSWEFSKIQNLTDSLQSEPEQCKCMRGGKEYLMRTDGIGRKTPKLLSVATSLNNEDEQIGIHIGSAFDDLMLIDDTSVFYADSPIVEVEAETIEDSFALIGVDYQQSHCQGDALEYSLTLVATGPENAIPLILEQMQVVPEFAESVLNQAQQLAACSGAR